MFNKILLGTSLIALCFYFIPPRDVAVYDPYYGVYHDAAKLQMDIPARTGLISGEGS